MCPPPPPPPPPPAALLPLHRSAPSVSYGSTNLYMRGALESQTRHNLEKVRLEGVCVGGGGGGEGGLRASERVQGAGAAAGRETGHA